MGKEHPVALARGYAGITQTELAQKIDRTQSFVARMERGEMDYVPFALSLSNATGMALSFFRPDQTFLLPQSAITFRKRKACPAPIRHRADFFAASAHALAAPLVGNFIRYPTPDIPNIPIDPPTDIHAARIAGGQAAKKLREEWGIGWGPITDVIRLIESKGVKLFYVRESAEHLDGFAFWTAGTPYIFLNQLTEDPARVRLDACHELGHLVMHRELEHDSSIDLIEAMAHGFAAEFLAPWDTFKLEAPIIPDLNRLGKLRARWRISMQAMVMHMYAHGAISHTAYTNAFKRFSILGYRRRPEPGWINPDKSVVHAKFVEQVEAKGLSVSSVAEQHGISDRLLGDMIPATTEVLL
ncbi:MAG TPA: XRE family transcriptional regulator [Fimbriimonas sp.]|nr:XRE family transcriptional regulator [Fimbriimonas sp.]